jgi:hypothetical protein
MSHYSVLILGKNPEIQLFPYEELDLPPEELAVDPRAEFEVTVSAQDFEAKAREIIAETEKTEDRFPGLAIQYRQLLRLGRYDEIFEQWFGGQRRRNGDWGHYRNPEAKWDWFQFGGRWAGKLVLKPGRKGVLSLESEDEDQEFSPLEVDQACFGDVDWEKTRKTFSPFAVLKHGRWYEVGQIGWFGATLERKSDEAWEDEISRLLDGIPDNETVSVYDCHI